MEVVKKHDNTRNILLHQCKQDSYVDYYLRYCHFCGKMLPSKLGRVITVFRPARFNKPYQYNSHPHLILESLLKNQNRNRLFNTKAAHIDIRNELVVWLEGLCVKLEFYQKTLQLAVCIMDVVFAKYAVPQEQIKLTVFMGLVIAAKAEESPERLPSFQTVRGFFGNEISLEDLIITEQLIFKILNYSLSFTTPFDFMAYFVYRGVVTSDDFSFELSEKGTEKMLKGLERLLDFFFRASLLSYQVNMFKSVTVACAVVYCARKFLGCNTLWNKQLELLTGEMWVTVKDCAIFLERIASEINGNLCQKFEIEESVKSYYQSEVYSRKAREAFGFPLGN